MYTFSVFLKSDNCKPASNKKREVPASVSHASAYVPTSAKTFRGNLIGNMLNGFILSGMVLLKFMANNQLSVLPILLLNKSVRTLKPPSLATYELNAQILSKPRHPKSSATAAALNELGFQ